jgi:hypothetical protein
MLSIYRADKEDNQLEDAKHQSILRSAGSFPFSLQIITQVTERRSFIQKMGATGVSATSEHGIVFLIKCRSFAQPELLFIMKELSLIGLFGSN